MRMRRDDWIEILRRTKVGENAAGEPIYEVATVLACPCEVTWGAGDEKFSDRQKYAVVPATVRLRWTDEITVLDTALLDGVPYDIKAIIQLGRREATELRVERAA